MVIALVDFGTGVKINRLEVPEVIKHGDPVTLDCDFTLEDNDQDLVVKWFFNKTLVYQWIPGTKKRPQGLGILKDRLNLEYAASVDANSRHRALHIWKAGPDLSGDYTCSVSTLQSEDIETKSMLVLDVEKEQSQTVCLKEQENKPVDDTYHEAQEVTPAENKSDKDNILSLIQLTDKIILQQENLKEL
ncbi:unnamed protein product [Diabrotica balteata]|uniref:Ig-like domain-containing protein n=1 Tax=Diabrotica balteata TaxID=107213 RepID=A0A9N9SLG3_DIABA|nr:unnamed protein product [Diabrotica balteata]